jgi:hypothetical protein
MGPIELLTTAAWVVPWLLIRAVGYAMGWTVDFMISVMAFMVGLLTLDPCNERMRERIAIKNPTLANELEGDPPLLKLACICEALGMAMDVLVCALKLILFYGLIVWAAFAMIVGAHQALSPHHRGPSVFFR